jgi:ribosomal-protein-alanine N-acetyltransferase
MTVLSETKQLEIRVLRDEDSSLLADFFDMVKSNGDDLFFHPHELSVNEAQRICNHTGQDIYYGLWVGTKLVGYAILRGWDDGYTAPSLGIALHPSYQGQGLGKMFMHFLHAAAKCYGASQVRLKVYPKNERALHLYRNLGYQFLGTENNQLIGTIDL